MHSELVVLGGGPGGYAAAFLAADLGMSVTVVDQQPSLGGTCLLQGCIPSKALLHVGRAIGQIDELADWGVRFAQPEIDANALRAAKEKVVAGLSGGLAALARKRKVRVVNATGVFEDSKRLRLEGGAPATREGNAITYDHLILATGSRPTMPKLFNLPTDRVMTSTGALLLADVPERLLVVGGGYIGLELGSVYARLGSSVTVVEMTDGLLPGADRDLVRPLARRLDDLFDSIRLSTEVTGLTDCGDHVEVGVKSEAESGTESFDRVLVAIGRQPNSQGIGLEATGVQLDEHGFVVTDDRQCTADDVILAVGDVAGQPMLAHKATRQGKIAVETLTGGSGRFDNQAIPAVVFTDPELAWAGLTETEAKAQGAAVTIAHFPWAASGRAQAMGRTDGLTKLIVDPESEAVLGVGIVGAGAGELIAEAVLAIETGCAVRDITDSIHPHPTMSETLPGAGDVFHGLATEVYKPKRAERRE